ncbi:hypothetical protein EV195_10844 [Tenacibaculum skagerrakense]|uniref:Uncharacterized protein n=1 Tax=Tenacibaculum skagerrakense TaxID=186571 RepID=A0A4R2NQH8_9FLAO|nr:hypothetical protein [Tenacibaculum skagerrakense]TCP23575.1 hypothetical protein EV195_10844 [Tenacibaculum skagerrakense]
MKNLKNLEGVKILSKNELSKIEGAAFYNRPYCGGPRQCCIRTQQGFEFCDYGYCMGNGQCIWA